MRLQHNVATTYRTAVVALLISLPSSLLIGCVQGPELQHQSVARDTIKRGAAKAPLESPELVSHVSAGKPLRVLTYNVHLLPSIAAPIAGQRGSTAYRAATIAKHLPQYDLVGLCEAFHTKHVRSLVDSVQAGTEDTLHVTYGPSRTGRHLVGSGLLFLSKFPITATHTTVFRSTSEIMSFGFKADGFAAKGVLHARVLVDAQSGSQLDCFLTHLDSQSPNIRSQQVDELCSFIDQHQDSDVPMLIMGDFNIASHVQAESDPSSEYQALVQRLEEIRLQPIIDVGLTLNGGPRGTSDALASDGGRRIDYILVSAADSRGTGSLTSVRTEHLKFLDPDVPEGSLSDHLAVECSLPFKRSGPLIGIE